MGGERRREEEKGEERGKGGERGYPLRWVGHLCKEGEETVVEFIEAEEEEGGKVDGTFESEQEIVEHLQDEIVSFEEGLVHQHLHLLGEEIVGDGEFLELRVVLWCTRVAVHLLCCPVLFFVAGFGGDGGEERKGAFIAYLVACKDEAVKFGIALKHDAQCECCFVGEVVACQVELHEFESLLLQLCGEHGYHPLFLLLCR